MSVLFYIYIIMVIPWCTVSGTKTTINGKRYESMFCSMYVVTSVIMSSLTDTFLTAKFFPFCCQVSTNCTHLCFPIIPTFKEIYNEKLRNRIPIAYPSSEHTLRTLIKFYLFLREVKNICDNTAHLREYTIRYIFCCAIRSFYDIW